MRKAWHKLPTQKGLKTSRLVKGAEMCHEGGCAQMLESITFGWPKDMDKGACMGCGTTQLGTAAMAQAGLITSHLCKAASKPCRRATQASHHDTTQHGGPEFHSEWAMSTPTFFSVQFQSIAGNPTMAGQNSAQPRMDETLGTQGETTLRHGFPSTSPFHGEFLNQTRQPLSAADL